MFFFILKNTRINNIDLLKKSVLPSNDPSVRMDGIVNIIFACEKVIELFALFFLSR